MEYNLKVSEETIAVESEMDGNNKLNVTVGEKSYAVEYALIGGNQIHLDVNGRRVNVYVAQASEGKEIFINGASFMVSDADLLVRRKSGGSDVPEPDIVTPPMPAVVVSVMAKNGDIVVKGQSLVVVSAMKMETTLKSPFNGTVAAVNTSEGEKVNPGEILVDVIKAEDIRASEIRDPEGIDSTIPQIAAGAG